MDKKDKDLVNICLDKKDYDMLTLLHEQKRFTLADLVDLIQRKHVLEERKRRYLLVTYDVKGFDHDGYCSGVDGGDPEDEESWTKQCIHVTSQSELKEYLINGTGRFAVSKEQMAEFDEDIDGCTSGGSGYCKGMYQRRKCVRLELLEEC